jgi:hypothetical protein
MAAFSDRMIPEVVQAFWAAMQPGEFITDAAAEAGTYRKKGARWLVAEGGVRPRRGRRLQGRCLSFAEREQIALGRAGGKSIRTIAARTGGDPSCSSATTVTSRGICSARSTPVADRLLKRSGRAVAAHWPCGYQAERARGARPDRAAVVPARRRRGQRLRRQGRQGGRVSSPSMFTTTPTRSSSSSPGACTWTCPT